MYVIIGKYGESKFRKIIEDFKRHNIEFKSMTFNELTDSLQEYYKNQTLPFILKKGEIINGEEIWN